MKLRGNSQYRNLTGILSFVAIAVLFSSVGRGHNDSSPLAQNSKPNASAVQLTSKKSARKVITISDLVAESESGLTAEEINKQMLTVASGTYPNRVIMGNIPTVYTSGNSPYSVTQGNAPMLYTRGNYPNRLTTGQGFNESSDSNFPMPKMNF